MPVGPASPAPGRRFLKSSDRSPHRQPGKPEAVGFLSFIKMKKYLIFDTETTGLPPSPFPSPTLVDAWPRLVQLAFIVCNEEGKRISHYCETVKPAGWTIPEGLPHRITTEVAKETGKPVWDILHAFFHTAAAVGNLVAHNMDFDKGVIASEFYRMFGCEPSDLAKMYCTQKQTAGITRIPKKRGERGTAVYKFPSLAQLHSFCGFGEIQDAHDALADTVACAKCFFHIKSKFPDSFNEPYQRGW